METTPKIKRGRGRPPVVDGAVVSVNLRLSVSDRDALRKLGGASWVRAQLAAARQAGAMLATRPAE